MPNAPIEVEIDSVDHEAWTDILSQFDDASIDQTWSFANAADSKIQVSHLILRHGNAVVAACQIQLRCIPIFKLRVADISWGPLICRHGSQADTDVLARMISAIKEEYGINRNCIIRISPHVAGEHKDQMKRILETEGFRENLSERPYRTLMLDLSPSLDELRGNLLPRWRRHLNKAEKNNLVLIEGKNDELFQIFLTLAAEMGVRKNLPFNYERYRYIQRDLPEAHKMNIIVCQHEGSPVAATIGSAIGNTGIYLLGATGQAGLGLDASYLSHWRLIQWLKSTGMRYYDLGAINPHLNPGGYFFKQGIAGKSGWDETFLHRYHGCFSVRSRLASVLIKGVHMLQRVRLSANTTC
jgi:lipid II:glycine glycyltransferase (peptidoglycan interpeptide bridge formation enzyme)